MLTQGMVFNSMRKCRRKKTIFFLEKLHVRWSHDGLIRPRLMESNADGKKTSKWINFLVSFLSVLFTSVWYIRFLNPQKLKLCFENNHHHQNILFEYLCLFRLKTRHFKLTRNAFLTKI